MASSKISWEDLERLVRLVAQAKFGAVARAEDIAGVRCDCVLHMQDGSVVVVEISKSATLEKLRTDLAKFNVIRPFFFAKNIFPRCFFITPTDPTPALIESGKGSFVQVFSMAQFFEAMLAFMRYATARSKVAFGSAVDLYSGMPDRSKYVPVSYVSDSGESFTIDKIAAQLLRGRTIVLIGDYGAGKSRCTQQVFEQLTKSREQHFQSTVAINLRENWGLKRAQEILTRHFTDLGLAEVLPDFLKLAYSASTNYLLDGFDEIGAQTWSDDPTKLVAIRQQSLSAVKDLIAQAKGGVLITGRQHYFNNDAELVTCLGLDRKSPLFLRCNEELSSKEFSELLGRQSKDLPAWVPKKPLIAAIIRDMGETTVIDTVLETSSGEVDFWNLLIDTICEREARINPILDPLIIRALYTRLGRVTRTTRTTYGPVSIKQINEAFEQTTGRPPTDESAIVLQRLPGLSRIGAESLDRQFADVFILDGLKAEDVLDIYAQGQSEVLNEVWTNPVGSFGASFVSTQLQSTRQTVGAGAYLKRHRASKNKVLLSDLLAALFQVQEGAALDLGGVQLDQARFESVALADTTVTNVRINDSVFEALDITDTTPDRIKIADSVIVRLAGITGSEHAPAWLSNCAVEAYANVKTLAAIRHAGLSTAQTFLLSSLRKLFLQPGGGRRESSMYKGYGDSTSKKTCEKVIALLVREHFCSRFKGASEPIYVPDRSLTGRVQAIMSQMTTSKDPIWVEVSRTQ